MASQVYAYGDITNVDCTGASKDTAQRNGLSEEGILASHKMAQMDAFRMRSYIHLIENEANCRNIDPVIIAAIISRESRAGDILINGWGHDGNTFGLMQVCLTYHEKVGEWNSAEHIEQATGILQYSIQEIQNNFPQWSREQQLKGGIAAYNCGDMNVDSYNEVDKKTVSGDYSNDVVARAQWYKQNWHLLSP
ncbi:lysozyme g-like [Mixophyes fleayi]|uniref:lysozyme g-like n=1 Tax=Mixophyes fleayi TaxID=3061075 RepID=UPI003F4E3ED2